MRMRVLGAGLLLIVLATHGSARAFSGFYAGSTDAPLESRASTVVLMRDGERTVVSVRNDYRGPAADFAWVIPVPGRVEQVRTLRPDAFDRIERLSAPRLVELVERNPCGAGRARPRGDAGSPEQEAPAIRAEAQAADPVEVVILDAEESAALGPWLRRRGYRPDPAALAMARAYAESGHRFVVARVDASRLQLVDGRAALPPLRFHYRSGELVMPMRLGRVGARGPQDLVIHVLARGQRYEVANRADVLAPTNLVMYPSARERFGEVYATILDRVLRRHPGAVVTEYAWPADRCDPPCLTGGLGAADLDALGRDVIGRGASGFVLTRLHTWISGPTGSDLVLGPAAPIAGGRGRPTRAGSLAQRIDRRVHANAFQARYTILHAWSGPTACASPSRGRWGAPAPRRRVAITARPGMETIPTGRLRRFLHTWAPVLRIPSRDDAAAAEP